MQSFKNHTVVVYSQTLLHSGYPAIADGLVYRPVDLGQQGEDPAQDLSKI